MTSDVMITLVGEKGMEEAQIEIWKSRVGYLTEETRYQEGDRTKLMAQACG
jgi:hypothetical protein